jgi:hypothetical protein
MHSGQQQLEAELIATLGSEPQVVTAVLDLLLDQGESVKIVTVIHTHAPGTPIAAALEKLRNEFNRKPYASNIGFAFQPILDEYDRPLKTWIRPMQLGRLFAACTSGFAKLRERVSRLTF